MRNGEFAAVAARHGKSARTKLGLAAAVVLMAAAPRLYAQTTYTWVGQGFTEDIDGTTYADLFTGFTFASNNGSRWDSSVAGHRTNWNLPDGSFPTTSPGPLDTVLFGTGFGSGNPRSRENQDLYKIIIQTPTDFVLDFRDTSENNRTVLLRSGEFTMNTTGPANGLVGFVGNLIVGTLDANSNLVPVNALFDISGPKKLAFQGTLSASGSLTKKGSGTLDLAFGFHAVTIAGDLKLDDGEIKTYQPQIAGDIFIGDGIGAAESAKLNFVQLGQTAPNRILNNLTVRQDGEMGLRGFNAFDSITMTGGQINFGGNGTLKTPSLIAGPGSSGSASVIGDALETGSQLDLSNATPSVIQLTGATNADSSLILLTRLVAPSLVVRGQGTLTLANVGSFDGGNATILNQVNQTTIESGNVRVDRTADNKALGTAITIGKSGETKPAALYLNAAVPFDAATDVTLYKNGQFTVFNTTIDTLTFQDGGLVDANGSRNLTVNGQVTGLSGTNATATIQPNRITFGHSSPILDVDATDRLVLDCGVTAGAMSKTGAGTLQFGGTVSNSIQAITAFTGTIELNRDGNVSVTTGSFVVGSSGQTSNLPTIKWLNSNQFADSQTFVLRAGTLDLNGFTETIGGYTASGTGTMAIQTGAGQLNFSGNSSAGAGTLVSTVGTLNLNGGSRQFSAGGGGLGQAGFTNYKFSGAINSGTFNKTGVGTAEFNGVNGTATLLLTAGNAVSTGVTQFGGLSGAAPLEVRSGSFAVSNFTGQTTTYSGLISGGGTFDKRGPGELVLDGTLPNTFTGGTTVYGGTLTLNGLSDLLGNTKIEPGAKVVTKSDIQFSSTANLNVLGTLDLGGRLQSINTLSAVSDDGLTSPFVTSGRLLTTGGVSLRSAGLSDVALTIDSGGLTVQSSAAAIRGSIFGNSAIDGGSLLFVNTLGADVASLRFFNNLSMANGTTLYFALAPSPNANPLLDVEGALSLGSSSAVATVDLTLNVFNSPGKYALLQFGSSTVTVNNFALVPPNGQQGGLFIQNNTLYYDTAIPEPASLGAIVGAGAMLLRRSRRTPVR